MSKFSFDKTYDLTGQEALITGAAGGIGMAIATLFAQRGCRLVLIDRSDMLRQTAASLGPQHLALVGDVTEEDSVRRVVADAVAQTGRIDILINNAGIGLLSKAEEMPTEMWDTTMAVNLRGAFLFTREVGHHMIARGYGRVINMASQAATVALEGHLAYSASKAALLGMTRVLAMEWAPYGITANAISPTVVETELARVHWAGEKGAAFKSKIPTGRFAQPEEIAHTALYLVSGASGMINGADIAVDGGYTVI
jgi:D-threitol dehydrogenase (NAD+)